MQEKITAFFKPLVSFFMAIFFAVCPIVTGIFTGTRIYLNIPYGEDAKQQVDLYLPSRLKGDAGLILYVHGGWMSSDKSTLRDDCYKLSREGYASATLNFRDNCDTVSLYDNLEDISMALEAIRETAAKRGVDLNKLMPVGISAGCQLALMYAYTMGEKAPMKPVAAVDYCGITDISAYDMIWNSDINSPEILCKVYLWLSGAGREIGSYEEAIPFFKKVSPVEYVNENTVPTLVFYGAKDTTVPPTQAERLIEKLEQYGVEHAYLCYPNSDHLLKSDPEYKVKSDELLLEYAEKYLK